MLFSTPVASASIFTDGAQAIRGSRTARCLHHPPDAAGAVLHAQDNFRVYRAAPAASGGWERQRAARSFTLDTREWTNSVQIILYKHLF